MSHPKSNPPIQAVWLLRNACPGDNEALTGDLIETFREGRSRGWFWKQTLIAIVVALLGAAWRHWPQICYALAGTVPFFFWTTVRTLQSAQQILPWWTALPWPLSTLVYDLGPEVLLVLAALPILGVGLLLNGTFRWMSLLKTGMLSLFLSTLFQYLGAFIVLSFFASNRPHHPPGILGMLPLFSAFLVAAWLGCRLPKERAELQSEPEL